MRFSEHLAQYGINALFYIAHLANLASILENGILCRNLAERRRYIAADISNQDVQERRKEFFGYAPLFFRNNPPMLYDVLKKPFNQGVLLLEISTAATNVVGVRFSNGNAASPQTETYFNPLDLRKLKWNLIKSAPKDFNDMLAHKSARSSEMLIPKRCSPHRIRRVHALSREARQEALAIINNAPKARSGVKVSLFNPYDPSMQPMDAL